LEEIGGFESIVDYLADDFQLASKAARAGYRIKLPDYIVDIVLSGDTLRNVLSRELRWAQTVKVSNPTGYLGMVVSHGLPYALFYAAATGFSTLGWTVLLGAAAIRLVTAYIGARICLSDREFPSRAHLLPLRDLLTFAIWAAAYFTSTVKWRGRKLRLTKDGRIAETG
jgi:ceramide glucosyltransferase